jgi:hypothetical protein
MFAGRRGQLDRSAEVRDESGIAGHPSRHDGVEELRLGEVGNSGAAHERRQC